MSSTVVRLFHPPTVTMVLRRHTPTEVRGRLPRRAAELLLMPGQHSPRMRAPQLPVAHAVSRMLAGCPGPCRHEAGAWPHARQHWQCSQRRAVRTGGLASHDVQPRLAGGFTHRRLRGRGTQGNGGPGQICSAVQARPLHCCRHVQQRRDAACSRDGRPSTHLLYR